jgi:hypothetical protein
MNFLRNQQNTFQFCKRFGVLLRRSSIAILEHRYQIFKGKFDHFQDRLYDFHLLNLGLQVFSFTFL